MAAVDKFEIIIEGKGGHGARPHDAIDSIVIGSDVVNSLQKIVSRRINPLQSAVVTIGVFQAGNAFNVIADSARLEGTVRTFDEKVREQVKEEIYSIVKGITEGSHANYQIDYLHGYPALYNHKKETDIVRNLFSKYLPKKSVVDLELRWGGKTSLIILQENREHFSQSGPKMKTKILISRIIILNLILMRGLC